MAGAIRLSRSKRLRVLSLTPLIDVVFMLLLFFMLATSFSRWRSVELVTTVRDSTAATPELASAVLTVLEKQLLYDKVPMTLESFIARLNAGPIPLSRTVVVEAADSVSVQRLISVLDQLSAAGITNVNLNVSHR